MLYEDKANGVLSETRFQMPAGEYETEQEELRKKAIALADEIAAQEEETDNLEQFIAKIHKYFDLQELTPSILNDLVKKIYVHAPNMLTGNAHCRLIFIMTWRDFCRCHYCTKTTKQRNASAMPFR